MRKFIPRFRTAIKFFTNHSRAIKKMPLPINSLDRHMVVEETLPVFTMKFHQLVFVIHPSFSHTQTLNKIACIRRVRADNGGLI